MLIPSVPAVLAGNNAVHFAWTSIPIRRAQREQRPVGARLVDRADKAQLDRLAATHLDLGRSVVVVVGPRAKIEPQLAAIGLGPIEASGPEGQ